MAILKFNDGKRFVEASKAPLPQSEIEVGFRKDNDQGGLFMLRYDELANLQKRFNPFYLTRLQLLGVKIEAQKAQKAQEMQLKINEEAKP